MGVLNVTPDSFTDGGRFLHPDQAYARALELEELGADVIDLGAESTRPESKRISAEEEWGRLAPVLKRLRGKLGIPVSLDTYKAETAARALEYDVEIINDPSGLTFDPDLAKIAMEGNAGLVLNHMRGTPQSWGGLGPMPDPAGIVLKDLDATASRARRAGVEKNRIMIDPGLGFGKRKEQNSDILAQLGRLAELDYPILVGPSRKSFLAHLTPEDAVYATASAVTAAILNGAHMVRVHDVKAMKIVVAVADEIARMAMVVADRVAEEEDAERQARKARAFPAKLPPYMMDERVPAMRPPLKPVVKPTVPVAAAVTAEGPVEPATNVDVPVGVVPAAGEEIPAASQLTAPAASEAPVAVHTESNLPVIETESEEVDEIDSDEDEFDEEDFDEEESDDESELDESEDEESEGEHTGDKPVAEANASPEAPAPPSDRPAKAWTGKPANTDPTGQERPQREGFEPPRRFAGPPKPFGDRPPRRDFDGPPRRDFDGSRKPFGDRPPQGDRPRFDGPPRRDFSGPPPRRDFAGPRPRRDFAGPPPRRDFGGPPPRRDFDGPPRREGGYGPPQGDGGRPPRRDFDGPPPRRGFDGPPRGEGPPRRDFGGDRPPRRDFDGPPRREGGGGFVPPRSGPAQGGPGSYGPPRGDGPPRRDFGGDRPPRRDFDGPPRRESGGGYGPPRGGDSGGRPPYKPFGGPPRRDGGGPPFRGKPGDRPFRPSGPRPDDRGGDRPDRGAGGGAPRPDGGGDRPYGAPGGGKKLFRKRP